MDRVNDTRGTEAAQIAATAASAWNEARLRLSPVIGEQGFFLLYKRSVRLTTPAFPWLVQDPGNAAAPVTPFAAPFEVHLADLASQLERETPEHAAQASQALFATFTGLLNVLIGVGLTTHLLASVAPQEISDETPRGGPPGETK